MNKLKAIKSWFPIKNIENGIIETKGGRLCKILEISPINFELKSTSEKEVIIYQYKTFLKTCNFDMQILILSKKNEMDAHIEKIFETIKDETNEKLEELVKEYAKMIREKTLKTTITRRFFIIFCSYDLINSGTLRDTIKDELNEKTAKVIKTLGKCGNEIKDFSECNFELIRGIYEQLNRKTAEIQSIRMDMYEKF